MEPFLIILVVAGIVVVIAGTVIWKSRGDTEAPVVPAEVGAPSPPLRARLARTRGAVGGRLSSVLARERLDDAFWDELEETLIAADLGVATASTLTEEVRASRPEDGAAALQALETAMVDIMTGKDRSLHLSGDPAVVLVVGVNGTGKTTSIAKLAAALKGDGRTVILAAADTFRAAAAEQLTVWAERVGVEIVTGPAGSDPAAVAYEAYRRAGDEGYDTLIVDTAGRLHSKANLMEELGKVARVLQREAGEIGEVLLVLDGTTGQNAIAQADSFAAAVGVTGIVMTKLDGTARGGIAIGVEEELGVPVKYIGVGEGIDDLVPFEPQEFVEAVLEP